MSAKNVIYIFLEVIPKDLPGITIFVQELKKVKLLFFFANSKLLICMYYFNINGKIL